MEFYESFMKFSFADSDAFCIEKDPLVTKSNGMKACECVVLLGARGALIEAKASAPKELASSAFMAEIKQKFSDSLRLFNDIRNRRYGEAAFLRVPERLRAFSYESNSYLICLIVHGHQLDWLVGLQDAFREAMREVVAEWHIQDSNVRVYNEETALESKLIVAYIPKEERDTVRDADVKSNMSVEKAREWFLKHDSARRHF